MFRPLIFVGSNIHIYHLCMQECGYDVLQDMQNVCITTPACCVYHNTSLLCVASHLQANQVHNVLYWIRIVA